MRDEPEETIAAARHADSDKVGGAGGYDKLGRSDAVWSDDVPVSAVLDETEAKT